MNNVDEKWYGIIYQLNGMLLFAKSHDRKEQIRFFRIKW